MQQRGHLNDTIVVNQPRITNEDMLDFDTTTDSIIIRDDGDDILSTDEVVYKFSLVDLSNMSLNYPVLHQGGRRR